MEAILNVVVPVFAVVLTGYAAGRLGFLGAASSEALNLFVYYGALPALLFVSMAKVPPDQIFNLPFIGAYGGGMLAVAILAWLISRFVHGLKPVDQGMHGFCSLFGNTGYMGIPLGLVAFGQAAVVPAAVASVLNSAIVVGTASAFLEVSRNRGSGASVVRDILRALLKNPLVLSPLAGIAFSLSRLPLPGPVETYCQILGGAAGPGALFALGLFLKETDLGGNRGEVASMVLLKLVAQPLVTLLLVMTVFPMDPMWTSMAVLLAALPTGTTVFVLAQRYDCYVHRSSAAILVSSVLSVISVALVLTLIET